jgi:type III secretion protein N (ATPase)
MSRYQELELLLQIGEYQRGSDAASDMAIDRYPEIVRFLRQRYDEQCEVGQTRSMLRALCGAAPAR